MGQITILFLQLINAFVSMWSKDQKIKDDWAAALKRAKDNYNSVGAGQSSEMKKDYDDLQKELKEGKHKL